MTNSQFYSLCTSEELCDYRMSMRQFYKRIPLQVIHKYERLRDQYKLIEQILNSRNITFTDK